MVSRKNIFIGLAVSAGVLTGIGIYLSYRRRPSRIHRTISPISIVPSLKLSNDSPYLERNSSSEIDVDETDTIQLINEIKIPNGSVPLTPDQACILTQFLFEHNNDEKKLHCVLNSIANASTFKESQINLANAGCITRLRQLLLITDDETIICQTLLALTNLALNDFAITQFSMMVPIVINLCRANPLKSLVRKDGLCLLINMSVLENLHKDYMDNINELSLLLESTIDYDDELLSIGKILVNLSINKSNLENLLKITGIEIKTISNLYTIRNCESSKCDDVFIRFLIFYSNLAEMILQELKYNEDTNNNNSWLFNSKPHRQGAVYFEFFDFDKQILAKSFLHPQYKSTTINNHLKHLNKLMDKIHYFQISCIQNGHTTNFDN